MAADTTLYWHDYETWGVDPSVDRPCQFAGVRTDEDLNIIGDPLVEYCKPAVDILPHPQACLITGITPQKATKAGLPENEFIDRIHSELNQPGTCGVGYNSIRFDDEVTRYTLFRNFYDPYEREWANGNSRWDIIDMVRLCYALRPDGIEWPKQEGRPSFRLELLTQANNISHAAAHDAYSDVEATIKLAALIKRKQPALYDYVYQHRQKKSLLPLVDLQQRKPLLHVSSMISSEHGCTTLVMPLAFHPTNKNALIVFDLTFDPQDLIALSAEELQQRVFTSREDLPEGVARVPLKCIHLNKCPILGTAKLLDENAATRLGISKSACERNWLTLKHHDLREKVQQVMGGNDFAPRENPERQLYQSFIPKQDKKIMIDVRLAKQDLDVEKMKARLTDPRLQEILWLYKARNFPDSLDPSSSVKWRDFVRKRLLNGAEGVQSIEMFISAVTTLEVQEGQSDTNLALLQQLRLYTSELKTAFA